MSKRTKVIISVMLAVVLLAVGITVPVIAEEESTPQVEARGLLARVAENALAFQARGTFADRVHVTLVTPQRFRDRRSRFYAYKYSEYRSDPGSLLTELEDSPLPYRNTDNWRYPDDLEDRIARLQLHWVTFEELLAPPGLPPSPISDAVESFAHQRNPGP